uniref:Acetylglucosaminyltransferase, putative n=1 Tax=Arundo donax TaxID=35708 RepID=A0A0A9DDB3_ARUDO
MMALVYIVLLNPMALVYIVLLNPFLIVHSSLFVMVDVNPWLHTFICFPFSCLKGTCKLRDKFRIAHSIILLPILATLVLFWSNFYCIVHFLYHYLTLFAYFLPSRAKCRLRSASLAYSPMLIRDLPISFSVVNITIRRKLVHFKFLIHQLCILA